MRALQAAQWQYDNQLPPPVSESAEEEAERCWIEEGIDQLMRGADYVFKRRMRPQQGVTQERFAVAVEEFAMDRLCQGTGNTLLGRLILSAHAKHGGDSQEAAHNLLAVPDPDEALRQIAHDLLMPFAEQGVLAQAEEAE
ncbi:hypothetical protein [Pseudomonas cremoricolorata]|uniref:Uncharacterized protein n=1 Tax=Pseudomonas cremoricolorata TaxID=157783 RepID=A0A089WMF1_9PSED|nr:hypothetical protein [Pseudomonas cremoricolorata]AIR90490.1 hypothetical protein LK03_14865 [Pseudomonas cremoricolorata]